MIYFNILMISLIFIFIIDISGFIQSIENKISKWINVKNCEIPKPFSCSLCMTFWTGLVYLLLHSELTLFNICFVCYIAYLTRTLQLLVDVIILKIEKLIKFINDKL